MPVELKNIKVNWISLVKAGANRRKFIYKSADAAEPAVEREIPIAKYDEEKGIVYGIVYSPDDLDTDGEFAKADEIEAAAHGFLADLKAANVDKGHSFEKEGADVVESWVLKEESSLFPDEPAGAWAVGIKVHDEELKKDIKTGKLQALSMAGFADKVVHKAASFDDTRALDGLWDLVNALERSIRAVVEDEAVDDKAVAISDNIDQFKSEVLDKFGVQKSAGGGFRRILKALTNKTRGADDMKKEEVQAIVKEEIEKALKELPQPVTKESMADGVKTAIEKAIEPVVERLEAVEKTTPGTRQNKQSPGDDGDVDWAGIGDEIAKSVNK